MAKLDAIDSDSLATSLTFEDLTVVRRQLAEVHNLLRETVEKLGQSQIESELAAKRRDEVEARLSALEGEYEELLGGLVIGNVDLNADFLPEKTIHDEETSNIDVAESMAELKVCTRTSTYTNYDNCH